MFSILWLLGFNIGILTDVWIERIGRLMGTIQMLLKRNRVRQMLLKLQRIMRKKLWLLKKLQRSTKLVLLQAIEEIRVPLLGSLLEVYLCKTMKKRGKSKPICSVLKSIVRMKKIRNRSLLQILNQRMKKVVPTQRLENRARNLQLDSKLLQE